MHAKKNHRESQHTAVVIKVRERERDPAVRSMINDVKSHVGRATKPSATTRERGGK